MAAICAGVRISFDEIHRILKQRFLSLFLRSIVEEDAFGVTRARERDGGGKNFHFGESLLRSLHMAIAIRDSI